MWIYKKLDLIIIIKIGIINLLLINLRLWSYGIGLGGWVEHTSNFSYNWTVSNEDDFDSEVFVNVSFVSNK